MTPVARFVLRLRSVARATGLAVIAVAVAVLVGWAIGSVTLTSILPGVAPMRPNTVVGLVLLATGLILQAAPAARHRGIGRLCAALALALAVATLLEYLASVDLGIDLLLFRHAQLGPPTELAGRISPHSCVLFVLLSLSLLSLDVEWRGHRPAEILAFATALCAFIAFLGYAYAVRPLYSLNLSTGIAIHTSACMLALACGILGTRSDRGAMRTLIDDGPGGYLARRLLPLTALLPFFGGLVLLIGVPRTGTMTERTGATLLVALTTLGSAVGVWRVALALSAAEAARQRVEAERAAILEQAQASRRQAERALLLREEFLVIAAHELKTPLTALLLQTEGLERRLLRGGVDGAVLSQRIGKVAQRVRDMTGLVERLLDVQHLDGTALVPAREELDLAEQVRAVAEQMAEVAARAGCALEVDAPAPIAGSWDGHRLEQVWLNLIANAIKYGRGLPVQVQARLHDGRAEVTVGDRGIGIAPGDLDRIFERFERAASVTHYGGFGLGLYIARTIVVQHGGTIGAVSSPAGGTVFTVTLPLM